jgi:predicted amidophosphoribosyltransferase
VKNIVRDMKYHDKPYIAENIAEIMADRAYGDEEIMGADLIIPTPMFAAKKRKRGYNQAELIAARLAELTGIEYAPDILVKNHQTEALSTKNRDERALLLSGAFSADGEKLCVSEFYGNISQDISSLNSQPRNGKSARVLLIDDVFTTGATSNACARALYSAGAATVDLFVFATGAAN